MPLPGGHGVRSLHARGRFGEFKFPRNPSFGLGKRRLESGAWNVQLGKCSLERVGWKVELGKWSLEGALSKRRTTPLILAYPWKLQVMVAFSTTTSTYQL